MGYSNIMDSNSFDGTQPVDPTIAELITDRERVLGPAYRLFYDDPVHLVRGLGTRLFDADGREYLDAYNNVACVGHAHPRVTDAVARQISTLNTHTRYLHSGIVDYSIRLLETFPGEIDQIMFCCTGSEANDLALRVAAQYTGARGVIITANAYHGNTAAVTEISPSLSSTIGVGEHVRTVPIPDTHLLSPVDAAQYFAANVAAAAADLQRAGFGVSALIVDTLFSSDGIFVDPRLLGPAVAAVRAAGGVFIADEVQPGFGRTGAGMWGFDRHAVVPDLVTMGKPMCNGIPVAAMAASSTVLAPFATEVPYFNTFGGSPVAAAAATAVLDIIEEDKLIENAATVGGELLDGILDVTRDDGRVGDVRGSGLYIGVEIVTDEHTRSPDRVFARCLVNDLRREGILISVCGADSNVLKIRPPLVFSSADVDWLCAGLRKVLG
ncbi:aspartate aminotransferase family protein [uncultured Gordonia sp.]|uniref:aspartate aminotransferase family protein n=1 Tax=uncultured Gordonia sp. TaxID=198437 RepID=UPI00258721F2|nr:aminotransferase class III-fold pyridoxal phosphate-dependent enzyme [uncultured Gordonia sp.]